ncbi:hypothetical protein [Pseudomonas oryzihabitans]|uniref:TnsE C-terminal domain-containing protein n=1 Tax=Pseudomonas oryzihabitans TaxID=47885 RepID=A0AAJ2BJP1_9PSED|nr:hypothetical protein [Pseudomonas psychrotolerans]MDR6234050.1 hypothetical protein [Pseudomonas psychrotolerans]MDR6356850.1 hypothetical protein [Pseudomonas psychrotolerans]
MVELVKRIDFSYPRSDLQHPDSGVQRLKGDYLVWWYGPVRKSPRAKSIPLATVNFRRLYGDVPGADLYADVPLSSLPHYRIGTIWREGKCISDTELTEEEFQVSFFPDGWTLTSKTQLYNEERLHIFPDEDYLLRWGKRDQCRLIEFKLLDGKQLLIPCLEFFVRAYARNMEVCRALATLKWSDVMNVLFDVPIRSEHHWLVRPSRRMRDYDKVFLAHLLYDDHTERCVKRINSQFISRSPKDKIFLEAEPWFTGKAQLLCRGRWINQGSTFLCLDLSGMSRPDGPRFEWQRIEFDSSEGEDGAGRLILPRPVRTAAAEEFLAETSNFEPDHHSETVIVKAPPFTILGGEREFEKTKRVIETDRSQVGPQPSSAEIYSSGEGTGAGKNTGKLESHSEAELESKGFLRDIWNAFNSIKADNQERVSRVDWYTPSHGFNCKTEPKLIPLSPTEENVFPNPVRMWTYIGRTTLRPRGIMVIRIKIDGQNYFCFEIQREESEAGKTTPSYAGALIKFEKNTKEELNEFINEVCLRACHTMGRFKNMRSTFPSKTKIFKHTQNDQNVLYKKRLINAFKDLDVKLN